MIYITCSYHEACFANRSLTLVPKNPSAMHNPIWRQPIGFVKGWRRERPVLLVSLLSRCRCRPSCTMRSWSRKQSIGLSVMTRSEIFLLRLGISPPPKRSGMLWSAPVRRPRLRTAWLPGVQPERSPGAAAELGPCLRRQVLRDSESHHRHPGGRFPSPALEPGTAACTGGFFIGIPHPEEVAGTEAFVFGPGQDSHNL